MGLSNIGDKFLVYRNNQTQSITQENLMAKIEDTDYMLVNRNDVTHKITGSDVIDSFVSDMYINSVIISNPTPRARDTISVTLDAGGGSPPYTIDRQWGYRANSSSADAISNGETGTTFYIVDQLAGSELFCEVTITDSRGTRISKKSAYTAPILSYVELPISSTIEIVKETSGNRFTNQLFKVNTTYANNGIPASNKLMKAWISGTLKSKFELAPLVSYVEVPIGHTFYSNSPNGILNRLDGALEEEIDQYPSDASAYVDYVYNRQPETVVKASTSNTPYYLQWDTFIPINIGNEYIGEDLGGGQGTTPRINWYCRIRPCMDVYLSDESTGPGNYKLVASARTYNGQPSSSVDRISGDAGTFKNVTSIRWEQARDIGTNKYVDLSIGRVACTSMLPFVKKTGWQGPGFWCAATDYYPTLTFQNNSNFDKVEVGDDLSENGGSGYGRVVSIDSANSKIVIERHGPWTRNEDWDGIDANNAYFRLGDMSWTVGSTVSTPLKADPISRKYVIFNSSGNVIDLSRSEPSAVIMTSEPDPSIPLQFPATFPSGSVPDDELLDGTSLTASVYPVNEYGGGLTLQDTITPGTAFVNLTESQQKETQLRLSTYEIRRDLKKKADEIQELVSQGFTQAEIDAVLVIPQSVNGYFPLYETEAAANTAGNGSSHSHTFNGITYYMPNGVTFYHGDYNESSNNNSNDSSY